jgi:protein-S-isoprenylcysteine O-methyltransferase Ste14
MKARLELKKKAGYGSLVGTAKLKIVKEHKLVTDGLYQHIRHPLYLGEIEKPRGSRNLLKCVWHVNSFVGFNLLALPH